MCKAMSGKNGPAWWGAGVLLPLTGDGAGKRPAHPRFLHGEQRLLSNCDGELCAKSLEAA